MADFGFSHYLNPVLHKYFDMSERPDAVTARKSIDRVEESVDQHINSIGYASDRHKRMARSKMIHDLLYDEGLLSFTDVPSGVNNAVYWSGVEGCVLKHFSMDERGYTNIMLLPGLNEDFVRLDLDVAIQNERISVTANPWGVNLYDESHTNRNPPALTRYAWDEIQGEVRKYFMPLSSSDYTKRHAHMSSLAGNIAAYIQERLFTNPSL